MPVPLLVVAAGAAVLSGVAGAFGAKKANKAQRRAAKLQAAVTFDQRMEEIRRLSLEQDYTEGLVTASAAASGVEAQGSPTAYLKYVKREHGRRKQYAIKAARDERFAIEQGAPGSTSGNLQAASHLLSGISSAVGMYK